MVLITHGQPSCENSTHKIPKTKQLFSSVLHVIPSCVMPSTEEPQSLFQEEIHPFVQCIHVAYTTYLLFT